MGQESLGSDAAQPTVLTVKKHSLAAGQRHFSSSQLFLEENVARRRGQ